MPTVWMLSRSRAAVLVAIGLCVTLSSACLRRPPVATARSGVIDLSGYDGEGRLALVGEWAFYWQRFLAPEEVSATPRKPTHYVEVPAYWNRLPVPSGEQAPEVGGRLGGAGYGTYLLELRGLRPSDSGEVGVFLKLACTSHRLYQIDASGTRSPRMLFANGSVAAHKQRSIPGHQPRLARLDAASGVQYLMVHVSNFDHRGGGLCSPPVLDRFEAISHRYLVKRVVDSSIVGMLAVLAIYNLAVFLQRRSERASLWLAAAAAVMLGRTLATEAFFELFAGSSSRPLFEWSYKTEYITLALIGLTMARVFYFSFPEQFGRWVLHYTRWPSVALILFVLFTPLSVYSRTVVLFDLWLVIGLLWLAIRLSLAWIRRVPFAAMTSIGVLPVFAAGYYDMAVAQFLVDSIYLIPYAMILFICSQGSIVAKRLSVALDTEQRLTSDLEGEVERQTIALRERARQLEDAQEKLQALSVTDALTGVHNRLYFDQEAEREWGRARRAKTELALLIIDLDNFKEINDQHGHGAGDRCLRAVAAVASSAKRRPADLLVRYGGDEFVMLLPDADEAGALKVASRIRESLAPVEVNGVAVSVGLSIGVAVDVPGASGSLDRLLAEADGALYQAKSEGRGRTVVAGG